MPPVCSICSRDDVDVIDEALRAGAGLAVLARERELSPDSLARHRGAHLAAAATAVVAVAEPTPATPRSRDELEQERRTLAIAAAAGDQAAKARLREIRDELAEIAEAEDLAVVAASEQARLAAAAKQQQEAERRRQLELLRKEAQTRQQAAYARVEEATAALATVIGAARAEVAAVESLELQLGLASEVAYIARGDIVSHVGSVIPQALAVDWLQQGPAYPLRRRD